MIRFIIKIYFLSIFVFVLFYTNLCYADDIIIMYDRHGQQQWVKRLDNIYFDADSNQYREDGNNLAKYSFTTGLREWLIEMPKNTYFYKIINSEIFFLLQVNMNSGGKYITYDTTGNFIWSVDFHYSSPGLLELADSVMFLDFSAESSSIKTYQYSFSGELLLASNIHVPYDSMSDAWISLFMNDDDKNIYYLIRAENTDSRLYKINSSGKPEWSYNLELEFKSQYDLTDRGVVSPNGNTYILVEERKPAGLGMIDCRLIFIDHDGQRHDNIPLQWPAKSLCWNEIRTDSEDNILFAAFNDEEEEYTLLKIDKLGNIIWIIKQPLFTLSKNGYKKYEYYDFILDTENNIYLAGEKTWDIHKSYAFDMHMKKYKPNGDLDWVLNYSGPDGKSDKYKGMNTDKEGNVYLIGKTENSDDDNEEKGCGF